MVDAVGSHLQNVLEVKYIPFVLCRKV